MDLRENKGLTPVESGMPIVSITMDLTKRCNLACHYCFAHCFEEYDGVDLTPEMGKKILDWVLEPGTRGDAKAVDVGFWGGEPLLKWDLLKELVLYGEEKAKNAGVKMTFGGTTNVTLLTPDKFDFCDEHNIRFLLSIDGTKEHHNRHRVFKANGKGSWDIVDKNATEILKRWPDSQARFSYSVENLDGIMEDIEYLYNKGFHDIVYSPVSEGDWTEERLDTLKKKWVEIADWYIAKKKAKEPVKLKFLEDACKCIHGDGRGQQAPCGAGRGYIGITVDGAIYPCHRFNKFDDPRPWYEREVCMGHVEYGILNQEWRRNFTEWNADKDMPESCHGCKAYKMSCVGSCWATNYDLNGSLRKVPHSVCVAELATIAQAEQAAKELGEGYVNSLLNKRHDHLPKVQGCQCYNVQDNIFGRQTVESGDPHRCLCNMSTYGSRPEHIKDCGCYNVENNASGVNSAYYDSTGASCRNFHRSPLDGAIAYLKEMADKLDQLTENELKKVDEFMELKVTVEAKEKELETLQDIRNTLEK